MFNIGGGELLVIFLVVLIFIGPTKLPEVARTLGKIASSIKKMNTNFQDEMKRSFDEPIETIARERGHALLEGRVRADTPDVSRGASSRRMPGRHGVAVVLPGIAR